MPVPETWLTGDLDLLVDVVTKHPLIIKPSSGRPVAPIVIARSADDLHRLRPVSELMLAQEYVEGSGFDLKVYVIGERVFGVRRAYRRSGPREPGEPQAVTPEVRDIALRCGEACGLSLYGLDVIESAAGLVVVDINYFPSFLGVPHAADLVADHIESHLGSASGPSRDQLTTNFPTAWPIYRYPGANR